MKLVLAGALALVLKLTLALCTAGTNDARTWEQDLITLRTALMGLFCWIMIALIALQSSRHTRTPGVA